MIGPSSSSSSSTSTSTSSPLPQTLRPPRTSSSTSLSTSAASSFSTPSRIPSLIQNLSTPTPPPITSSSASSSSSATHTTFSTSSASSTITASSTTRLISSNNFPHPTLTPPSTRYYHQEPFSSPSSVISSPPTTSTTLSLPHSALPPLSVNTAPSPAAATAAAAQPSVIQPLPIIKYASLEATRDGQGVQCSWFIKASLLGGTNGSWTTIPLIPSSVALESWEIHSSPNPDCPIITRTGNICLLAKEEGNYEVYLKFRVATSVVLSRTALLMEFIVPAPTSPQTVIVLQGVKDVKVTAQNSDGDRHVNLSTKNLTGANPTCVVPSCNRISACWNIPPEDIAPATSRLFVSSMTAKWTVGQKKMNGTIDIQVSTEPKGSDDLSKNCDAAIVDLSLWLTSVKCNSVLDVKGSQVLSWTQTSVESEPRQRLFVRIKRLAEPDVPCSSSPLINGKFTVIMESPLDLSMETQICTIPMVTGTNKCDSVQAANVYITTSDPAIQLHQLPHPFLKPEAYEPESTYVPVLVYSHFLWCEWPDAITFSAHRFQSKSATTLPVYVNAVQITVSLSRIADAETRATVCTRMKICVPTTSTCDRKGLADSLASPCRKIEIALQHAPSPSSAKTKPIELWSITANGEKINNACILQDGNVTKLSMPLVLPLAPSSQQQILSPFSLRSGHPVSHANQEGDIAHGAGRIVEVRFAYMTEVVGDSNGGDNTTTAVLPLPSFDVPVGNYEAVVDVNDDPPHSVVIWAPPANVQPNGEPIYFKRTRKDFESAYSDQLPFSSITCSSERRSSGISSDNRLGGVASYVPSKTAAALMRDQISGLGKRDKGVPNGDVGRDKAIQEGTKGTESVSESEDVGDDAAEQPERDGRGGSMDVDPIQSKASYAFETVILPPNMLVFMRIQIGKPDLRSVLETRAEESEGKTAIETHAEKSEDEVFTRPLLENVPDENPIRFLDFLATLAVLTFLSLIGVVLERVFNHGESSHEALRFVAEALESFFARKGMMRAY